MIMSKALTQQEAAARFATIESLHEFGVALKCQTLKAKYPEADEMTIHVLALEWLGHGKRALSSGLLRTDHAHLEHRD